MNMKGMKKRMQMIESALVSPIKQNLSIGTMETVGLSPIKIHSENTGNLTINTDGKH
jgi:hypothetical protein